MSDNGYRDREIGRIAEQQRIIALLCEHREWYPAEVFDDAAGRAIRWKLTQLIDELQREEAL